MRYSEFSQPLDEGVHDPHIFKAVFMAGSPGSGKSTIANKLFKGSGLKPLNVDDYYNYMRTTNKIKGNPEEDYPRAWEKYRVREKNYLDGRLGLIIDGTGKNTDKIRTLKHGLETLGYETAMIFINTTLEVSLSRAEYRASKPGKDFGRDIDPRFIEDTWKRTQRGLGELQGMFGQRFYIIDNNRGEPDLSYVQKSMKNWLDAPVHNHAAREWIKNEHQAKQR